MAKKNHPPVPANHQTGPPPAKWEDSIKHIERREWSEIRSSWASVSELSSGITIPSQHGIGDLPAVIAVCQGQPECKPWHVIEDIAGLREGVMVESYILLLKAINVLGGAQVHIENGACSWSLSSGYHASFFAAKAICGLLGVSLVELVDRAIIVDVWAPPERLSTKKIKAGQTAPDWVMLIKWRKKRVDHEPVWKMFQRLVRVTRVDEKLWPKALVDILRHCQPDSFAAHRNRLHYENHYWPYFDELAVFTPRSDFGTFQQTPPFEDQLAALSGKVDYSVILGFALCWLANVLFVDLAKLLPGINGNKDSLDQAMSHVYHQRFREYRDGGFLGLLTGAVAS